MQLIKMVDEDEKIYSEETLKQFSYRSLQQLAKSMSLPSNVKKLCLIELIRAKKYCSTSELEDLIKKIKANRKKTFKKKKDNLEFFEKTNSQYRSPSPMITSTPKHKNLKQCINLKSHETNNENKPQAQTSLNSNKTLSSMIATNGSDRILRSFHLKKLNKINHSNDEFASTSIENTLSKKGKHKEMVKTKKPVLKINMNSKSLLKRPQPNIVVPKDLFSPNPKQAQQPVVIEKQNAPPVRTKTIKWIYPFGTDVQPSKSNIFIKNLSIRQSNGTISKLKALIQRRDSIKIQQIGDSDLDVNTEPAMEVFLPNDDHNYINDNPLYDKEQKKNIQEVTNEDPKVYQYFDTDSLYYNDMYGELACCKELTTSEFEGTCRLPKIDEVFKTFKKNDFTQPLYVETSDDWRESYTAGTNNSGMGNLDNLYYSNSQYDINEPLLKLANGTDTFSWYNTSVLSPIMADHTSDLDVDQFLTHTDMNLPNDCNDGEETDDIITELFKFSQIMNSYGTQDEDHSIDMLSMNTSQESATNMTIHDMVDDAIEIIRKDGGYLDDIGNVIIVQCIFCAWAGTQNLLEDHVKNTHSTNINKSQDKEWIIKFHLGYLVQSQLWLSEIVEHGSVLYVVSVKYQNPDCVMATIATLSSEPLKGEKGKIVIYNTVTGELHTWKGPIQFLSANMPHFNDLDGLNIKLSTLNLIPNTAKLSPVNPEQDNYSYNKVVVDQPDLNDKNSSAHSFFCENIPEYAVVSGTKWWGALRPAPRQRIPKDGPGPRGAPDCYYTSRVLNSTFRYVKFVRKLRAEEEEQKKGAEIKAKEAKDHAINDFFLKCDRKSLINDVARRVDLCLASYQEDLKIKRERLKEIFAREEEENIRKFVEQVQAGAEAVWQDKKDRLQYLLAKRKKEHAEKYKDTPLSKCVHVLPCIVKLRAMEAQDIQLYQMKEKQARKMAEKEFDKMWHEVAMKEADALAARMEYDAIERLRRDIECNESINYQVEQNRLQREREKELLKEQTLRFKAIWDEENRKEEAAQLARKEKTRQVAEDSKKFLEDKQERIKKESAEQKLVSDAWDSLAGQGLANDLAKIELRKRKERELDECNKKLIELKKQFADLDLDDSLMREEARRIQEKTDQIRCKYQKWAQDTNKEVRQAMIEQIKDRTEAREELRKKIAEEDEYNRQLRLQLEQLVENKMMVDAKARKNHQKNLLHQMEYTNLLKERARQEELDQLKKYQIATEEYEEEIKKMLCRPFFSDEIHPFMKQMAKGLKMAEKCPCSKKDYCK